MAGKGISIGVAADTREFSAGVAKGVIKPLDGIVDALEDVAKEGDDAGEKLDRSLRDSQDETERLKKDYKNLGDTIEDSSRTSSRNFTRNTKTATTAAGDDLKELGKEAKANFAETLSSFDGTVQGTINGIQGTLGGVTSGLKSTAGIAAAAAGAAGLGLVVAAFEASSEAAKQMAADANDAFDRMTESGNRFYTQEQENDIIKNAIKDPEQWKRAIEFSKLYGITAGEAIRIIALEGPERDKLVKKLQDQNKELETSTEGSRNRSSAIQTMNNDTLAYLGSSTAASVEANLKMDAYVENLKKSADGHYFDADSIKKRNDELENTPATTITKLLVDDSAITKALAKPRTLNLVIGAIGRNGVKAL